MSSSSQGPHSTEWKILYRAAIYETNDYELPKRISDAENAIIQRMREIFRENGVDAEAEREALDDALYALRAWKIALENRTRAA